MSVERNLFFSGLTDGLRMEMLLWLDQMSLECILDLSSEVCNAGKLVIGTYNGTLPTVEACKQMSEYHQSPGYEKDSACFQDLLLSLVEVYKK